MGGDGRGCDCHLKASRHRIIKVDTQSSEVDVSNRRSAICLQLPLSSP